MGRYDGEDYTDDNELSGPLHVALGRAHDAEARVAELETENQRLRAERDHERHRRHDFMVALADLRTRIIDLANHLEGRKTTADSDEYGRRLRALVDPQGCSHDVTVKPE